MTRLEAAERRARLARMYEDGMSLRAIAAEFGISHQAIYAALKKTPVRFRPPAGDAWAIPHPDLAEMVTTGATYPELMEHYKVSQTTVYKWCRTEGLKPRRSFASPRSVRCALLSALARELYEAGEPIEAIAKAIGSNHKTNVYRYLHLAGVTFNSAYGRPRKPEPQEAAR